MKQYRHASRRSITVAGVGLALAVVIYLLPWRIVAQETGAAKSAAPAEAAAPAQETKPAAKRPPKFPNETGWQWHIYPDELSFGTLATSGIVMRLEELKEGKILLMLAYGPKTAEAVFKFQPIAFDSSGKRIEFSLASGGGDDGVKLHGFLLDPKIVPLDQVKNIGLEKLTFKKLREVVAPAAYQELKTAGNNALPYPQVGEKFEFELTTIDGRKISSADLRGKVVLLDFWAKWCGPCMEKMPKLKETYARLHDRGFEVVGISYDITLELSKQTVAEQNLPWAIVHVPIGQRDLWVKSCGVDMLPHLMLIDRQGVLRAETTPSKLDEEIGKLVDLP